MRVNEKCKGEQSVSEWEREEAGASECMRGERKENDKDRRGMEGMGEIRVKREIFEARV